MRSFVLGVAAAGALAASGAAAQSMQEIPASESILKVEIAELDHFRRVIQYSQAADFRSERYYIALIPPSGAYPRLQVVLDLLARGMLWTRQLDIDEAYLRGWPALRDATITELNPASSAVSSERLRTTRFRVNDAPCFAFSAHLGAVSGNVMEAPDAVEDRSRLSGFFCGARSTRLSDAELSHVLAGLRVHDANGRVLGIAGATRSRLENVPKPAG